MSTVCAAGLALPTIVAHLSFALWVSAPGRRIRSRRPTLDLFWSGLTAVLLSGQLGLLISVAGLWTDSDYSNFVQPFGSWKPAADALLIAVALVNVILMWVIGKHVWRLWRQAATAT